ncbi:MAG: hypothetical protein P8X96_24690, partial [Desulfobacteraceae bacterium]
MKTIINQSSSNFWVALALFMTLGLLLGVSLLMKNSWPPNLSFEWFLLPSLAVAALLCIFSQAFWVLFPRNFTIEIGDNYLKIHEKPLFKTKTRVLATDTILSIDHYVDHASYIVTKDGKQHKIHQVTMMKK